MKRILFLTTLSVVMLSFSANAQTYLRMMNDPSVNFYDVVKEADAYFANRDKGKGTGYAPYQRWKYANESHFYPSGNRSTVSPYFAQEAYISFLRNNNNNLLFQPTAGENGWKDLGPYTIDKISGHYAPGLGRVESFYVDPKNPKLLYLGSRSGGFWRSTDEGKSWVGTTDFLFASGVNTIAVSPTNPDLVLINVRNAGNGVTHGIYNSTDGGLTWQSTKFNPTVLGKGGLGSNFAINEIAYNPYADNMVFVCANDGLYRSTDNLSTWTKVINNGVSEIEFHPTNPNIVYIYEYTGANRSYVMRSTNKGQSFTKSNLISGNNDNNTVNLSVSNGCPDCLFFASSNGIWKSIDNGLNFTYLSNPKTGNGAFAVNDINQNNMIYGGIDVVVSTDGGSTFNQKTWWALSQEHPFNGLNYVHADLRVAGSIGGVFYLGTDGYLTKSTDGGNTWSRLSEGVGIRENYSLGTSQSNTYRNICGSQDNGQSLLTEKGWLEIYGADGMEGIIHPLNADWMIGSWQNGGRRRSKNGAESGDIVTPPGQKNASWIAPLLFDPNNHMKVFSFSDSVYKSENFGTSWTNLGPTTIGSLSEATIAENSSDNMLIASGANLLQSTDGGKSFIRVKGLPNYNITDIAFDPKDDNTIIVTYNRYEKDSSKVFISRDFGWSWQNITYNLYNMPINTVVIDHSDASNIYLGAEIGVFYKSMDDTEWKLYNPNLPNVSINDLKIQYGTNTLRAATWGRGLWEYPLAGRNTYPAIPMVTTSSLPTDNQPVEEVPITVTATVKYNEKLSEVFIRWSKDVPIFTNSIVMKNIKDSTYESISPIPDFSTGTKIFFKVFAIGVNRDTTETYKYMYTINPFKYCEAIGADNTTADYINFVSLAGISNSSANEKYGDFTEKTIELVTDSAYTLQIGMNFHWEQDTVSAWIDYNHNAVFEKNEQIHMSELDSNHKAYGTFSVPISVAKDTTRMRVRSQFWNENPDPCGNRTGEVEDYTIIFKQGPPKLTFILDQTALCKPSYVSFRYTGDQVDSLRWELTNGGTAFKFASTKIADSTFLSLRGVYTLNLSAYRNGSLFSVIKNQAIVLTIVDTSVTQVVNKLRANAENVSYRWLDCSDGHQAIKGATSKEFQPSSDGLFAVEVMQNGCRDTSLCFNVKVTSVEVMNPESTLPVYPNPTTGQFEIDMQTIQHDAYVSVIDIHGKKVAASVFKDQSKLSMNISNLPNGPYYIEVKSNNNVKYYKVVKFDGE